MTAESARQLLELIALEKEAWEQGQKLRELTTRLRRADPRGLSEYEWNCRLRAALHRRDEENAALRQSLGETARALAEEQGRKPEGPPDELDTQIAESWQRLYQDYKQYRSFTPYPKPRREGD